MLTYKDRTFCIFHELCSDGKGCDRALTGRVRESARRCGLPICQFASEPECFKPKKKKETQ